MPSGKAGSFGSRWSPKKPGRSSATASSATWRSSRKPESSRPFLLHQWRFCRSSRNRASARRWCEGACTNAGSKGTRSSSSLAIRPSIHGSAFPRGWLRTLPPPYPFIGETSVNAFGGPSWYWNRWQWPLNGWPNLVITLIAFIGFLYIAVRLDRTWFEFVWLRMDRVFCRTLRNWVGGQPVEEWSEREARFIRRSFLVVTIIALLACVVAGSGAAYLSHCA